jgi:hypothetical protein
MVETSTIILTIVYHCFFCSNAEIGENAEDRREKIQALSLAKECYSMKLELLTNATVVDDAIRFVSSNTSKDKKPSSNNSNEEEKESKEPDYDEDDKDHLEEEKQEEETGEITINQVF